MQKNTSKQTTINVLHLYHQYKHLPLSGWVMWWCHCCVQCCRTGSLILLVWLPKLVTRWNRWHLLECLWCNHTTKKLRKKSVQLSICLFYLYPLSPHLYSCSCSLDSSVFRERVAVTCHILLMSVSRRVPCHQTMYTTLNSTQLMLTSLIACATVLIWTLYHQE